MVPGFCRGSYSTAWRRNAGSMAVERLAQPARNEAAPIAGTPAMTSRRLSTGMLAPVPPGRIVAGDARRLRRRTVLQSERFGGGDVRASNHLDRAPEQNLALVKLVVVLDTGRRQRREARHRLRHPRRHFGAVMEMLVDSIAAEALQGIAFIAGRYHRVVA